MDQIASLLIELSLGFYFGLILFGFLFTPILQKKKHFPVRLIAGVIVGLAVISLVPEYRIAPIAPSTRTLTIYAVFIALWAFCYKGSFKDFLFVDICALTSQHFSLCVTEVVTMAFGITDPLYYALLSVLGAAVSFVLIYFVFARKLKQNDNYVDRMDYTLIFMGLFLFLVVFLAQRFVNTYEEITVSFRFFDGLTCFLGLYILFIQLSNANEAWEKRLLQELMESERKRYVLLEEGMDAINRKAHDLKYTARAWAASDQNPVTDRDMQDEYIEDYDYIARTGCAPLDTVLTEKGLYCRKNDIVFTYLADGEKLNFMNMADISVLFGNLLDNAIECVAKYEDPEKRIISVSVAEKEGAVRIRVENYCEDHMDYAGGLPVSHKGDRANHGFGLKSIRYIVEKYGGMLSVGMDGRQFYAGISIPHAAGT